MTTQPSPPRASPNPVRGIRPGTVLLVGSTLLFVFLTALTRISNYDVWFHLATGRHILAVGFSELDPFSYTQPDAPMYLQSWLPGVFFHLAWLAGGTEALTLVKALMAVLIFALLWQSARSRPGEPLARQPSRTPLPASFHVTAAVVLVVAAFALKFRLFLRPHLFELVMLAAGILLLDRYRWRLLPLAPALAGLQLLWINCHASFVLGLGLPILFLAGDAVDAALGRAVELRRAVRCAAICTAASLVAMSVNPDGLDTLLVPFTTLGRGQGVWTLGEWQPLRLAHLTGFALRYTWGFGALAVLGFAGLAGAVWRGRRPPAWEILLFLLFFGAPFAAGLRFTAEFAVVASPLVIRWWVTILPRAVDAPKSARWQAAEVAVALVLPLLWWGVIGRSSIYQVGLGEKHDKFPARAVEFLKQTRPPGEIFNSIGFGGYLTWKLPEYEVFIDGRWPVYTEEFFQLYRRAHGDAAAWQRIEDLYAPSIVMLEYMTDLAGKTRMPHLEASPAWALVFWDPVAKVYLKRIPANAEIIARHEYRFARPARYDLSHLADVVDDVQSTADAISEYRRAAADDPANAEAWQGLAYLQAFGPRPSWDAALESAARASELAPDLAAARAAACRAHLGRGDRAAAAHACDEALALAPVATSGASPHGTPHGSARASSPTSPPLARAWFDRGVASLRERDLEAAVEAFRESIAFAPGNAGALSNLGFCLSDLGRYEEAIEVFGRVGRATSQYYDALYGQALAHTRLGHREQAIALWTRYVREAPDSRWKSKAVEHLEAIRRSGSRTGAG